MILAGVDYTKLGWYQRQHHARYKHYVEANGFPCQECRGAGGYVEPVLDYGEGPWFDCGWCEGTGLVTRWDRGRWLACAREAKRAKA